MLPIEDRAVRMAQYDTEGHDIGEAINELKQAIEGVGPTFDGELKITSSYNPVTSTVIHRLVNDEYVKLGASPKVFKVFGNGGESMGIIIAKIIQGSPTSAYCLWIHNNYISIGRFDDTEDSHKWDENARYSEYIDTTPTENSGHLVTSGGVYAALAGAGGTKLYLHNVLFDYGPNSKSLSYIDNSPTPITSFDDIRGNNPRRYMNAKYNGNLVLSFLSGSPNIYYIINDGTVSSVDATTLTFYSDTVDSL